MFDQSLCEISRGLLWELLFMNCNKKSHFDGMTLLRRVKDLAMSLFARSRRWCRRLGSGRKSCMGLGRKEAGKREGASGKGWE